eukprot:3619966-Amphidinium_carterae.1
MKGKCTVYSAKNQPLCLLWNVGRCWAGAKKGAGQRCAKGWHLCCHTVDGKACEQKHRFTEHAS